MHRLGIDLGGTKIEAALFDDDFSVLARHRVPTPGEYTQILDAVESLASRVGAAYDAVGICTPGAVLPDTGTIKNSNTQCLMGKELAADLHGRLGTQVSMENDANCFALAEAAMGAGRGHDMVFGVIMGTGVGGGIVIDGHIHRGRTNLAGEWGHHTLHRQGNPCYCGLRGCVETYISGPALESGWTRLTGQRMPLPEIARHVSGTQAQRHDGAARWKGRFLEDFGAALANVINILDPDVIVLGGGVSNIPFLYDEGRDAVYRNVFGPADTPILQNLLGDSAGVYGAAMLC